MNILLASIPINIDPDLFNAGNLTLTWHGLFTLIAVALSVFLVERWSRREGLVSDAIMTVSVWAIIGGIVGARVFHVIDRWEDYYQHDPVRIVQIWSGGIAIYGAILGGFLFGASYIAIRNHPGFINGWNRLFPWAKLDHAPLPSAARLADIATPALIISMFVGRLGDIMNGEHVAKLTDLPWGFVYEHPKSASHFIHGFQASHPAIAYEMLLLVGVLAIIWPMRNRIRPHGMLFALYLAAYSLGVFFIRFLRTGPVPMDEEWAVGLNEAQFIALIILVITVPLLLLKAQLVRPERSQRPRRPAAPTRNS